MKKITFLIISMLFVLSCSKENEQTEDLNSNLKKVDFSQTIHYKGVKYDIDFYESESGEFEPISEIPEILSNLDDKEELATIVDGDNIYLFDDEREKFEYYDLDYDKFLQSRIDNELGIFKTNDIQTSKGAGPSIPMNISNFKFYVKIYHHRDFKGVILGDRLTNWGQLKYLNSIGWDNEMSSIKIHKDFILPKYGTYTQKLANRRNIIFYNRSRWRGRSIELIGSGVRDYDIAGQPEYKGTSNLAYLLRGFVSLGNWNDKISSIDIGENGRSLIR